MDSGWDKDWTSVICDVEHSTTCDRTTCRTSLSFVGSRATPALLTETPLAGCWVSEAVASSRRRKVTSSCPWLGWFQTDWDAKSEDFETSSITVGTDCCSTFSVIVSRAAANLNDWASAKTLSGTGRPPANVSSVSSNILTSSFAVSCLSLSRKQDAVKRSASVVARNVSTPGNGGSLGRCPSCDWSHCCGEINKLAGGQSAWRGVDSRLHDACFPSPSADSTKQYAAN